MMGHTTCLTKTGRLAQRASRQLGVVAVRETASQDSFRAQIRGFFQDRSFPAQLPGIFCFMEMWECYSKITNPLNEMTPKGHHDETAKR